MSESTPPPAEQNTPATAALPSDALAASVAETGGRMPGPDPTRFGDWEKNGRCIDF
jgi:hypothetical protein